MRAVSFFTIVYILFLLSQPCQDVFAAPPSVDLRRCAAVQQPQPPDSVHGEFCSPFCICSCCGLSVGCHSEVMVAVPKRVTTVLLENLLENTNPALNIPSYSIWQPPKD